VSFRVVLRHGSRVERRTVETLAEALDLLEGYGRAVSAGPRRPPVDLRARTWAPGDQVAARLEVAGPGRVRGGIDVRGDGRAEAWTGRLSRRAVPREPGESAYDALRRALAAG